MKTYFTMHLAQFTDDTKYLIIEVILPNHCGNHNKKVTLEVKMKAIVYKGIKKVDVGEC